MKQSECDVLIVSRRIDCSYLVNTCFHDCAKEHLSRNLTQPKFFSIYYRGDSKFHWEYKQNVVLTSLYCKIIVK